jgi:DNA polymerase-3 subunit alpha
MINEMVGFEHLHLHSTEGSLLDGYGLIDEYASCAKHINQQYLALTDHGMMSGIPRQIYCCEKHNLNPIFGCEIYYNPKQPSLKNDEEMKVYLKDFSPEEKLLMRKSYHMTLWAKNSIGYRNLVRLSSFGWLHGFYYKPRINLEQLTLHKEGIVVGSGCFNSPVGQVFSKEGEEAALSEIEKYHSLFGKDYYLEIMLLDFSKQKPYNQFLIKSSERLGIPLVISQDCHYCMKEDAKMQRTMLAVGSKHTIQELNEAESLGKTDYFELQDTNLWMKSEEELNQKWEEDHYVDYDLFKEAKRNSVRICEQCKGVKLDRSVKLPRFPDEDDRLKDLVMDGVRKRGMPESYWTRLREEFALVKEKEFSAYFIIQQMMTDAARKHCAEMVGSGTGSEAVGPGRGSAAGFLMCYLLGITDVDPVKHDLLSSRFLSPARGGKQMQIRFSEKPVLKG